MLDALSFDERLRVADAVVIGEGRIDGQSLQGKVTGEICARAMAEGVKVHALVGSNLLRTSEAESLGLASVTEATTLRALQSAGRDLALALGARSDLA